MLTFTGYSGAGYEDATEMLGKASEILSAYDATATLVNSGATVSGIGAVYELAKTHGFVTSGIVSQRATNEDLSRFVDHLFLIDDASWGGVDPKTGRLSPTSELMVDVSDIMVAIGGGTISRDELAAARALGKRVVFVPAEMNRAKAVAKAERNGLPPPTDFSGAVHQFLSER